MSIRNAVNRLGMLLAAVAAVTFTATTSNAAFTSVAKSTTTAGVVLSAAGTVSMTVAVQTIAGAADTQINWPGLALPAGWTRSGDVLALNSVLTASNGGIQIYTDNMNAAASPKFTGAPATTDPSGLVDSTNTGLRLPMAWSVKQATGPAANVQPTAAEPNDFATNANAPQWVYMADKATVAIPTTNTAAFVNGGQGAEVMDGILGVHAASGGGPQNNGFFPGSFPATYIFTQANFGSAATPRTYQTSMLMLEAFTQ